VGLTIISDVHGHYERYLDLVDQNSHTLQLGDFGLRYDCLDQIDPDRHKFFPGNHDAHPDCFEKPHCLGKFGPFCLGGVEGFFVSGAFSIDWQERVSRDNLYGCKSWWIEEQLDLDEMNACLTLYKELKPEIVISHSGPRDIFNMAGNPSVLTCFGFNAENFTTHTQELLQAMLEFHSPKIHIMGHLHRNWSKVIGRTKFIILPEFGTYTIGD
jgi:predicted phosphodiesterase